jgi:hypothetical protein
MAPAAASTAAIKIDLSMCISSERASSPFEQTYSQGWVFRF